MTRLLLAAFPVTLDEGQIELFTNEVALLPDAAIAMETARELVREYPRFPAISEYRAAYRTVGGRRRQRQEREERALEPAPDVREELARTIRDFVAGLRATTTSSGQFPVVDEGECEDRCGHIGERVQAGRLRLCRGCAAARIRVAEAVEHS